MQVIEGMSGLVAAARAGDTEAFGKLYGMLQHELYKTAYYILGKPEDAENAVSDAVLDAYAGLHKLKDNNAFRAWIFAILANKCKRYLREYVKNRESVSEAPVEDYAEFLGEKEDAYQKSDDKMLTEKLMGVLSSEERQIVSMIVFSECDSGEVAEILAINRNTVRSKYSRALQKMRDYLGKDR